jgi:hypothetical protein
LASWQVQERRDTPENERANAQTLDRSGVPRASSNCSSLCAGQETAEGNPGAPLLRKGPRESWPQGCGGSVEGDAVSIVDLAHSPTGIPDKQIIQRAQHRNAEKGGPKFSALGGARGRHVADGHRQRRLDLGAWSAVFTGVAALKATRGRLPCTSHYHLSLVGGRRDGPYSR